MKYDRFRVQIDDAYLLALGRAAYTFARLEWQVVWCLEKLKPGYIRKLGRKEAAGRPTTAGGIAKDFQQAVRAHPDAALKAKLEPPAEVFINLAKERNSFLHAIPGTAPDGTQLVFRYGEPRTIQKLEDIADEFTACEILLNGLFYGELGGP
jgi:hypothetical protein